MPSQAAASGHKCPTRWCARTPVKIASKITTVPISPPETRTAETPAASRRHRSPRVKGQNRPKMSRRDSSGAVNVIAIASPAGEPAAPSRCRRLASPSCLEMEPLAGDEPPTRDVPTPLAQPGLVRNWQMVHALPHFLFALHRCLRDVIRTRCRNGLNPALRQGSRRDLELSGGYRQSVNTIR